MTPTIEQCKYHDGLAESHVVSQAAAEPELAEEHEPAQAFALVRAKRPLEAGRWVGGTDRVEGAQPITCGCRPPVPVHLGCGRQQRIQQRHLRRPETQVVCGACAQGKRCEVAQPFLGQDPDRAVAQQHRSVSSANGVQQLRQGRSLVVEQGVTAQFEPVEARGDVQGGGRGGHATALAVGLDVPALAHEQPHDPRHVGRRHLYGLSPLPRIPRRARPQGTEAVVRLTLGFGFAACHGVWIPRGRERHAGGRLRGAAVVGEQEVCLQEPGSRAWRVQCQMRHRRRVDDTGAQFLWKPRRIRRARHQQGVAQARRFRHRHLQPAARQQLVQPRHDAARFEANGAAPGERDPVVEQQVHRVERNRGVVANEFAAHAVDAGAVVSRHAKHSRERSPAVEDQFGERSVLRTRRRQAGQSQSTSTRPADRR